MMSAVEIRRALSALLKQHSPYDVYFTNNASADKGYFHVELAPQKRVVDRVIYEREIDVTMELVLSPDARGRIDRAKLYEAVTFTM